MYNASVTRKLSFKKRSSDNIMVITEVAGNGSVVSYWDIENNTIVDGGQYSLATIFENSSPEKLDNAAYSFTVPTPTEDKAVANKTYVDTAAVKLGITGATVGQIAKITAVDENGVPTAWTTIDGYTGQVTAEKLTTPDNPTDLVQYAAFQAAVPMVQQMNITGSTVGQIIKISKVDKRGCPTEWEPVDMPSADGYTLTDEDKTEIANKVIVELGDESIPAPVSAAVGQIIRVTEVDTNGKITKVEAVDPNTLFPTDDTLLFMDV